MWKLIDGKLVHTTDESRVECDFVISKEFLVKCEKIALDHNSYRNYVIENGLHNLFESELDIVIDRKLRPKDRIRYRTTYDKDLVDKLRHSAKKHKLYASDIIEYSFNFINVDSVVSKDHRFRIERE